MRITERVCHVRTKASHPFNLQGKQEEKRRRKKKKKKKGKRLNVTCARKGERERDRVGGQHQARGGTSWEARSMLTSLHF